MADQRLALSPEDRAHAARAVADRLPTFAPMVMAGCVGAFAAMRGELDLSPTLALLGAAGVEIVYPRVTVGHPRLQFFKTRAQDLRPGAYGILEPPPDAVAVPFASINVILVPGLAFDTAGARLGYGGGYYDEVAARFRGRLVGVGYEFQVVDQCPVGTGDEPIHFLVTEARAIRCETRTASAQP